jgi:hypothetical protein
MRIPQIVMGAGLVILVVLLFSPQRRAPAYNSAAEVTLHGVVQDVRNFYCPISGDEGTHLTVATGNSVVEIHAAPSRFLLGKHLEFARGDQVDVIGSSIFYHGHEALIARTIIRGTQTVAVRKTNGKPLWLE